MFGFKETNARINAFADQLINDIVDRFPVEKQAELGTNKLKPARQLGSTANLLERTIVTFQQEARLGIYGKAKLLNRIKWALKERGYAEAFIDQTIAEMTRMLNIRAKYGKTAKQNGGPEAAVTLSKLTELTAGRGHVLGRNAAARVADPFGDWRYSGRRHRRQGERLRRRTGELRAARHRHGDNARCDGGGIAYLVATSLQPAAAASAGIACRAC